MILMLLVGDQDMRQVSNRPVWGWIVLTVQSMSLVVWSNKEEGLMSCRREFELKAETRSEA